MLETGYFEAARDTVINGMARLRDILPPGSMAFVHKIDNVLFSHGGLTESFVSHLVPDYSDDVDDLIAKINGLGKREMWSDASPIWARPQYGCEKPYPEGFLQVVGHTPVEKTNYSGGFLSVDSFSTHPNGDPVGDQRFVWVDTKQQQWGFSNGS